MSQASKRSRRAKRPSATALYKLALAHLIANLDAETAQALGFISQWQLESGRYSEADLKAAEAHLQALHDAQTVVLPLELVQEAKGELWGAQQWVEEANHDFGLESSGVEDEMANSAEALERAVEAELPEVTTPHAEAVGLLGSHGCAVAPPIPEGSVPALVKTLIAAATSLWK